MNTIRRQHGIVNLTIELSQTSKMPCPSYSISAFRCQTGSELAKIPGSVCHGCYARKGYYRFPKVQQALGRRLKAIQHPQWRRAMANAIEGEPYFRWHDSGDLQSATHLISIERVVWSTLHTKHWLPTKEYAIVDQVYGTAKDGTRRIAPGNLTIRVSAPMIDQVLKDCPFPTSSVRSSEATLPKGSYRCPSPEQGHTCGACRACWDPTVKDVSYLKH